MNGASEDLRLRLRAAGFEPVLTDLSEFIKAGGAAKCLTLKLPEA
jgi:N-dimethylarginine dimethylaminohydrolase